MTDFPRSLSAPVWMFSFLVVAAVGCGGKPSDQPDLGTVSGIVTLDGNPLADVVVTFDPKGGGRASVGKTDAAGRYELTFSAGARGAVIGTHSVSITTPSEAPSPTGGAAKDPIPAKYNRATTLTHEVQAGSNTINFDLTTK